MASLLLEVFNLLPKVLRDLSRGRGRMNGLREPVLGKEFLHLGLFLLLVLEMTIDDFLELLLDFYLHGTDLGRDNVAKLVLNGKLALKVLHNSLKLHKVLGSRSRNLFEGQLFFKVDGLVLVYGFVSKLNYVGILGVEIILVV